MNNGELDQMNTLSVMNHIFIVSPQANPNITLEQHEKGKKEAIRRDRMEVISNLDEE
jgi:hypothetical protein